MHLHLLAFLLLAGNGYYTEPDPYTVQRDMDQQVDRWDSINAARDQADAIREQTEMQRDHFRREEQQEELEGD